MRDVITDGVCASPFRLPGNISPQHYAVEIEPDLENRTFRGRVVIQLYIVKATQYVVFHAVRLRIQVATVEPEGGLITHPDVVYQPEQEAAYVRLESKLLAGSQAILTLEYEGRMTQTGNMAGLSPTPYGLPNGTIKFGFETMFEPTMARSVFPCFDEPDLKAEFLVSLIVPLDLACLSNMEVASVEIVKSSFGAPKKQVTFETSPKMSTYLVVMVGGYFNVIETDKFRVPIRIWAAPDKDIQGAKYALEIAVKAMEAHEKNFGLKYPLPKLDMVAVPGHQGGMEHWGCVTYEERGLILSENPSMYDKIRLAGIVAHELAHQWFGNIVTMKFWDTLWLNEAFASWAAILAVSQILPDYDAWSAFIAETPDGAALDGFQAALDLDSSTGSHAIQAPGLPASSVFDSITYLKGCSIIRMMAENIGIEVFLKGIRLYLERYQYGNATTDQLWRTLSEVSGRDVAAFMAAWTENVGYPVLTVNELRPTGQIVISQARFLQNGDQDDKIQPYPVLIRMRGPNGITTHDFTSKETKIAVNLFKYKLNADQVGFYRVSYPLSRIHKFGVQFAGDYLSLKDQIGIISDLGAVVATGSSTREARLPDFLDFLIRIKDHVKSLFVWREILGQLRKIQAAFLFEGDEITEILQSVRFQLLLPLASEDQLKFSSKDTIEDTFFKSLLFSQLKDHSLIQNEAKAAWKRLLHGDKDALDPNIKRWIFDVVVSLDESDATWNTLKSIALDSSYIRSGDPVTPAEAFAALGSSPHPSLTAHALEIITPSIASDVPAACTMKAAPFVLNWAARMSVLKSLGEHAVGAEASWKWLRDKWDLLKRNRKIGSVGNFGYINGALAGLATSAQLSQVQEFFANKKDPAYELSLTQAIDKIRARARFVEADRQELLNWGRR